MVGLQTFGTFTPILIALSFRQTSLSVGIPLCSGILGINARNLDYIFASNPRQLYRYADNKGVDIVLDREKGLLLLEINARPGLSIQIANREGLIGRLEAIDCALPKLSGVQENIAFAQETFAVGTSAPTWHGCVVRSL